MQKRRILIGVVVLFLLVGIGTYIAVNRYQGRQTPEPEVAMAEVEMPVAEEVVPEAPEPEPIAPEPQVERPAEVSKPAPKPVAKATEKAKPAPEPEPEPVAPEPKEEMPEPTPEPAPEPVAPEPVKEPEPEAPSFDPNELVTNAEVKPKFQGGGLDKFQKYINSNVVYPPVAAESNIQGRVRISFVVERDGQVSNVKVVKGVNPLLDSEAVRVVKNSPRWEPAQHQGHAVRTSQVVMVLFVLH